MDTILIGIQLLQSKRRQRMTALIVINAQRVKLLFTAQAAAQLLDNLRQSQGTGLFRLATHRIKKLSNKISRNSTQQIRFRF